MARRPGRGRFNFFWAFLFNIVGLPLAAGLFYPVMIPPLAAGIAMGVRHGASEALQVS